MATIDLSAGLTRNIRALNLSQFEFNLNRVFLITQAALNERLVRDIQAIRAKYTDASLNPITDTINALFTAKERNAVHLANVNKAVEKLVDIKTRLFELRNAVAAGDRSAFDAALGTLASDAWTSIGRDDNLIGSLGQSRIGARTIVAGSRGEITIATQYLGSNYTIKLADGSTAVPDLGAQTLKIGGTAIPFASLSLISRTGDTVQFSDGVTTYDGTVARGGLGILSSWLYGGAFANHAEAGAEVTAGLATLSRVDTSLRNGQSLLSAAVGRAQVDLDANARTYNIKLDQLFNAREAEVKAATARVNAASFGLSVTASLQISMVKNLFGDLAPQKQTLFQVLANASSV